jgi:hypothetical protein
MYNAVNCWPSSSGNETSVNIEYEASSMFDLRNVVISVPLPALREAPSVSQIDGEWRCGNYFCFLPLNKCWGQSCFLHFMLKSAVNKPVVLYWK